jgi:hypothetical protein
VSRVRSLLTAPSIKKPLAHPEGWATQNDICLCEEALADEAISPPPEAARRQRRHNRTKTGRDDEIASTVPPPKAGFVGAPAGREKAPYLRVGWVVWGRYGSGCEGIAAIGWHGRNRQVARAGETTPASFASPVPPTPGTGCINAAPTGARAVWPYNL